MKRFLILLLLTGCGTQQGLVRPPAAVEVDKIVTVRCIKEAPARPHYATEALTAEASDLAYGDALAGDWILAQGYEKLMETAVMACLIDPVPAR